MDAATALPEFFTDEELRERWRCSEMKLWRLRKRGVLRAPIKIGNTNRTKNLTRREDVLAIENGKAA
jgi:hypothetical protein